MTNFLKETLENLDNAGYTPNDITFIGSADHAYYITWDRFKQIADIENE